MNGEPSPIFLVTVLVIVAFVGTSIKGVEPIVSGLLLLILLGLILLGYGNIHAIFVQLGIAPSATVTGAGAGSAGTPGPSHAI